MMLRLLATLLILAIVDSIVLAQSQRVAYVPSASSDAENEDQDPRLSKLSPELADMVRRDVTYIGQQRNGSVVVEDRAASLVGLENVEKPGGDGVLAVNSERLIVEYPPGEPPRKHCSIRQDSIFSTRTLKPDSSSWLRFLSPRMSTRVLRAFSR